MPQRIIAIMGGFGVVGRVAACAWLLAGCATVYNQPVNLPLGDGATPVAEAVREAPAGDDDLLVALSFSGGGTRAAAFSFGVLNEMAATPVRGRSASATLVDRIDFVSGVSGGSVMAAYFGLKRRAGLADFRERFLLRDAEEVLRTRVTPANISRALSGGVNDASGFARWLDETLFEGATFAALGAGARPQVWINASDIYNRTTFVFGPTAFEAMCSDLKSYPIAEAVAASVAVPVIFAPVVVQTYPGVCPAPVPAWIARVGRDPAAAPMLKAYADAIGHYRDGSMPYIKLLDGGLVDNFGLSAFTIERLSADTPYGPLTPRQAVRLRRALTLVVDAGRGPSGNWTQTIEGPSGPDLVVAAADTAMVSSVRASFTAFDRTMSEWQNALMRWRCSLSDTERKRLGAPPGWNCRDLKFFVGRVGFDQLGAARATELDQVPTSFKLPPDMVDAVAAAGREALRSNPTYRGFLGSL
jgi:NTE family protein